MNIKNLSAGLQILAKYDSDSFQGIVCIDGTLAIYVDPSKVKSEDRDNLNELGFEEGIVFFSVNIS